MDETQIVEQHLQGLLALDNNNYTAARQHFVYAVRQGTKQCDIFRGLAACEPGLNATGEGVLAIYLTRATFGRLTLAAWTGHAGTADPDVMIHPQCIYQTGFFGIDLILTYPGIVHAAAAAVYIGRGQYDRARTVLDSAPADLPSVQLVTAMLYYRTERWAEVIEAALPLQSARLFNQYGGVVVGGDGLPAVSLQYQELSYLMSGTAAAHLGNTAGAEASLKPVTTSRFNQTAAEAHRVLGLLARASGDEQAAQSLFGIGLGLYRSDTLVQAKDTRNEVLRLTNAEMIGRRESYWDIATEPSLAVEQQSEQDSDRAQLLAKADADLQRQIGMDNVKGEIAKLRHTLRVQEEFTKRGLPVASRSNHLMFVGPPGTGKTSIARVTADIYAGMGVCRLPKIIEVTRKDLVGQHWGESGPKTKAVIDSARGGVLFIDEAYDLVQTSDGQSDPLGQEAVNVLLTEMDNHRDDLVVIIAGYELDIRRFLATNDGLQSRFNTTITFETYSPEELADIAGVIADGKGHILPDDSKKAIIEVISPLAGVITDSGKKLLDKAGNGRCARNIIEKSEGFKNARFASLDLGVMSVTELRTLTADDVRAAAEEIFKQIR